VTITDDAAADDKKIAALRVERRKLRSLKAHPKNPRKHPKKGSEEWETLRASLADEYFDPIVFNERNGMLISGHLRKKILIDDGFVEADCVIVDCDEDTHVARMIAANKQSGIDDLPKLTDLLAELPTDFDVRLTGMTMAQIDNLKVDDGDEEGTTDADDGDDYEKNPIEVPADPVSVIGEVYHLGPHRLMCGDCRNEAHVDKLMGDKQIAVAVTSPPYASQRVYDETSEFKPIPPDEYVEWFNKVQSNVARHLADDGSWFVNIKEHCEDGERVMYVKDLTLAHKRKWNWRFVDEFIWTHGGTPKAPKQRFKNGWEPIFQFTKARHAFYPDNVMVDSDAIPEWQGHHPNDEKIQKYGWTEGMKKQSADPRKRKFTQTVKGTGETFGDDAQGKGNSGGGWKSDDGKAYPSNVISCGKNREAVGHSAAYPIGLPSFFIKAFSKKNDVIYDPFLGSGTTMIAADMNDRVCYGMEISPAYCDIIRMRWGKYCEAKGIEAGADAL